MKNFNTNYDSFLDWLSKEAEVNTEENGENEEMSESAAIIKKLGLNPDFVVKYVLGISEEGEEDDENDGK